MNVIITCHRHGEDDAAAEAAQLLSGLGDDTFTCKRTGMSGLLSCQTSMDPVMVSRHISHMVREEPWSVRYVLRIIPVQLVVPTILQKISEAAPQLTSEMAPQETYRVNVSKRNSSISGTEIIHDVASAIPNPVSLDNPDRIIQIEIIGGITGMALLRPGDIFSLNVVKRSLTEE